MTAPRSPEQRARFVRCAASDLDIAPELAERLLFLSESARDHARTGRTDHRRLRDLLDCLLDDDVCRHAWVVAAEGERLWRLLLRTARPPRDVGPGVVLAVVLARSGAAKAALDVVTEIVRRGEFRRFAIELAADLAADSGRPDLAWTHVERLGAADPGAEREALRCVLGCSASRQCDRAALPGVTHARWLRQRVARWSRCPWSGGRVGALAAGDSDAEPFPSAVTRYLAARADVLPHGEAKLLELWAQARAEQVTVLRADRWEIAVAGDDERISLAGWEGAAPSAAVAGAELRCWLLPTLVPTEHLLVRSTLPPPW